MSDVAETLGGVLKQHREAAGLSQQRLSEKAGVSLNTIKGLETNRSASTDPENLVRLADALALSGDGRQMFLDASRWRARGGDERLSELEREMQVVRREISDLRTQLDDQNRTLAEQLSALLDRLPPSGS